MTAAKLNIFKCIRPRVPESLLTEGELRNTKGGSGIRSVANAARSIYTDYSLLSVSVFR